MDLEKGSRPSRRQFLARASLAGLSLPALGALLAGCEGDRGETGLAGEPGGEQPGARPTSALVPFTRYDPALPPLEPGEERRFDIVARVETVMMDYGVALLGG